MRKGKTTTGFEFVLDDNVLDDYELLEILADVDNGNYGKITEMIEVLLGSEQTSKLKEHVRNESGKVSAKQMMDEIREIFEASTEIKN